MPSIHAEIPGRTGGIAGGFDFGFQLTTGAARGLIQRLVDPKLVTGGLEGLQENDEDFYELNKLAGYKMELGDLDIRLSARPARGAIHFPLTMKVPGGDTLTGTAVVPVPLAAAIHDGDPRAMMMMAKISRPEATLSYKGPRSRAVLRDLSEKHLWGLILGLIYAGNLDLSPRNREFHSSGLHAFRKDLTVFPAADPMRSVLSIRTAFNDHQDLNLAELDRALASQGPVAASGGTIYSVAGATERRYEVVFDRKAVSRRDRARIVVDLTGKVRTTRKVHRMKVAVPLGVHGGRLVADFPAIQSGDLVVSDSDVDSELHRKVLADLHGRTRFRIALIAQRLAGVCGVVVERRSWVRLFVQTRSPPTAKDTNRVPPGQEIALVVDRRLAAGLAWDGLAAANPGIHRQHGMLLERFKLGASDDGITLDAWAKLDAWPDPARVTGHVTPTLVAVPGGGPCRQLTMDPDLNGHPPVTMMAFSPFLLGILGAVFGPVGAAVGIGLGALAVAFSPLLVRALAQGSVGSQGAAMGGVLNVSFSGFRFCARRLSVGAGGMVVSGRMIAVMGTSRAPLTLTDRQLSGGRTVGYGLSNGMVMPIGEIVTLMESGVTIEGVHIVYGRSGTWLRGDPDAERGNNLGALPVIE